jgi:hypothetical protein
VVDRAGKSMQLQTDETHRPLEDMYIGTRFTFNNDIKYEVFLILPIQIYTAESDLR